MNKVDPNSTPSKGLEELMAERDRKASLIDKLENEIDAIEAEIFRASRILTQDYEGTILQ